ncbi:MAG TPA: ribosome silencing factor [Candidatus Omnitrophota bacterium]|nr:ribosome silencing factor [Candidatus Omnitrophota bacterium]
MAAKLALERKAEDLSILDMRKVANFCDYFVICSASSQRRGQAIAELIEETFDQHGLVLKSSQGKKEGMWILLDYSDIVIHIFFKDVREYYALERLWADAKKINVPKDRVKSKDTSKKSR